MRTLGLIPLLLLVGRVCQGATPVDVDVDTNAISVTAGKTSTVASAQEPLPTWCVFKIKAFHKVTFSDDGAFAIVEGVTMNDKEFKVKLVWDEPFKKGHPRTIAEWLKKSKADFEAGIPYVISGEVISRDPLSIKPDTVFPNGENFGAPLENVY